MLYLVLLDIGLDTSLLQQSSTIIVWERCGSRHYQTLTRSRKPMLETNHGSDILCTVTRWQVPEATSCA